MKMFSKVTLVIAILAITALCFALPYLEPDERSYTDVNTNNQVKFSINTDFWDSGLSSTEIEGTGLDIFCFPWVASGGAQPHIYTITLTEPYHIDVAQGIDIENESVVPNPDGYGYLAKGVKEVTFRFPPYGEPDKGDIYVIVYSEVGVIYGISGKIDNTAYNKNYLLITDANNYMGDNVSSEVPSSSGATDFVSYYKDRDMLRYGAVSPYETTFPYELCSMLQIFRYRWFEYGVTFSSDIRKEDYISYLKELVSALRDDNNCSGVIFYCNDKSFYRFANDTCWDIREAIGDPIEFHTCIIQREETSHSVPNSRDAYISSDAYEKGYAIGYEFVRNGVQKNQFIYGENRGVFFIPTQSIVNSNNQTVLEPNPLLEYGIDEGISRAKADLDIISLMDISHQILYCENTQDQLEFYLHQLFWQTARNLFGENRYNIIGIKVFYNFVGNFDLGIINELSKDETLNGLPTVSNIFVEDATLYRKANENVINGNEICFWSRYFDADFTSVIGLSKTNSIVRIFAKYLLGKTGYNQYYFFVDLQQPRGYTVCTTNYLLYGYYINYVTKVINLVY